MQERLPGGAVPHWPWEVLRNSSKEHERPFRGWRKETQDMRHKGGHQTAWLESLEGFEQESGTTGWGVPGHSGGKLLGTAVHGGVSASTWENGKWDGWERVELTP